MANEAVTIELGPNGGNPVRFTVANATAISGGTLCQMTDPRTASASSGSQTFAGIAAADKVASDGATDLALYTEGIFDLKTDAAANITAGDLVILSGTNLVAKAFNVNDIISGKVVGQALETASASEVIAVRLKKHG